MSLRIIKQGLSDSIQDNGRYGFQHLGINPNGVMDPVAAAIVNMIVGNEPAGAVIEMHFPAPVITFEADTLFALSGGDFGAMIDETMIPVDQPVLVPKNSTLSFTRRHSGNRCYLSVSGGFETDPWLNSSSTNLIANAGGYKGRCLKKDDRLFFKKIFFPPFPGKKKVSVLSWKLNTAGLYPPEILFLPGKEYELLTEESMHQFRASSFTISPQSNRMGYLLQGTPLYLTHPAELISSAVAKGTMQLLPSGQVILLMADHQTTGGYPRIGHVISAAVSSLAQMQAGTSFRCIATTLATAEDLLIAQRARLQQIQNACTFRLQEYR